MRVAVEPRHPTWWTDEVRAVLEKHGAALCWADRGAAPITPLWRTTDWGYLRFHEGRARPWPRYGRVGAADLGRPAARHVRRGGTAYVYFNNDPGGAAITDASAFAGVARRRGLEVTRTP